jgi:pyruvate dehydrogenase E1 component alpha subunit
MPGVVVDGHDFFAVHEAAGQAIARARAGGGPTLLECKVNRYYGHFEGDQQTYRGENEVEEIRAGRDCLTQFRARVTAASMAEDSDLDAIDDEVGALIDAAVAEAKAGPDPTEADLLTDVYVRY